MAETVFDVVRARDETGQIPGCCRKFGEILRVRRGFLSAIRQQSGLYTATGEVFSRGTCWFREEEGVENHVSGKSQSADENAAVNCNLRGYAWILGNPRRRSTSTAERKAVIAAGGAGTSESVMTIRLKLPNA